jgi:hypothetical protein
MDLPSSALAVMTVTNYLENCYLNHLGSAFSFTYSQEHILSSLYPSGPCIALKYVTEKTEVTHLAPDLPKNSVDICLNGQEKGILV